MSEKVITKFGTDEYTDEELYFMKQLGLQELSGPIDGWIKNWEIQDFTKVCIENAPSYFWVVPAGKGKANHGSWAKGIGGLVKHTLAATYVFRELADTFEFCQRERDIGLSAVILHDSVKFGFEYDEKYFPLHPFLPRVRFQKYVRKHLNETDFESIMKAVETHMGNLGSGKWTPSHIRPVTNVQIAVHLADYISSRPEIQFEFFKEDV